MKVQVLSMLFLSTACVPSASADTWFSNRESRDRESKKVEVSSLQQAHQAFLESRYENMLTHIKVVLMSEASTTVEKNNAMGLIKRSYELGVQDLPVDWTLPDGALDLGVGLRRVNNSGELKFYTKLKLKMVRERQVKQLKVTQYPNNVLFDKVEHIGEFGEEVDDNTHSLVMRTQSAKTPQEKGLYLLEIELDNGAKTNGWFILSDEYASTSPAILAPAYGDQVETGNPTLSWERYRSPEYKPSEQRRFGIDVMSIGNDWKTVWDYYDAEDGRTQITVGDKIGNGVSKLEPGRYVFGVLYSERHRFGPMTLNRESLSYSRFQVVVK